MYEKILARSFSRYEQRKLGYGAFFACLLVVASFFTVFKPYLGPLPILNLRLSMDNGLKMLMTRDMPKWQDKDFNQTEGFIVHSDSEAIPQIANITIVSDSVAQTENSTTAPVEFNPAENVTLNLEIGAPADNATAELQTFDHAENFTFNSETVAPADNFTAEQQTFDQGGNVTLESGFGDQTDNATLKSYSAVPVENITRETGSSDQVDNIIKVSEAKDQGEMRMMKSEILCNFTLPRSNSCNIKGDVRVTGITGTVSVPQFGLEAVTSNNSSWKIKPYARKTDQTAMSSVREWTVKSVSTAQELPGCSVNHTVPAIIFSNGGFNGNHFHDFTDSLIPLFLCAKEFNGEVQLLATDHRLYWINKYRALLKKLSKYEIIIIDKEVNTHCFPKVIVGLTSHRELDTDPSMPPYSSLADFTNFMRAAYSLPRSKAIVLSMEATRKPRLMIISRKATRKLMNVAQIARMGKTLGYKVILAEGSISQNLSNFAESMNSCDVVLGVHGAGLTNIVFLPQNAVVIQIVPLGMEWESNLDFGQPARDMKLNYLDYVISKEESSLLQQYPPDHIVFKDPDSFRRQGWMKFSSIYLDNQDIKVDVNRLKPVLAKAMELLHQ